MNMPVAKATGRFSETVIDEEVVVMSLDNGDFFSLTGTAREIWDLIDGTRSRDRLIGELSQRHAVDPATVAADVDAFLDQLAAAGLVR